VRDTNGLQTTITLSPVNRVDQTLSLELGLQMALPMPDQAEHLPDQIEAFVHEGGLEIERRLFQAFVEKADQELVLQWRQGEGGAGIRLRGTRPFTFKTTIGEVTVQRSRIEHKKDGRRWRCRRRPPWNTSHQLHITQNLRTRRSGKGSRNRRRAHATHEVGSLGSALEWGFSHTRGRLHRWMAMK